jgi:pimeloyl-ACP methyl ester carboxylesterase
LNQFLNPFSVLAQRWRADQRLKLVALYEMYSIGSGHRRDRLFRLLESAYVDFERWDGIREYPHGSFAEFRDFLVKRQKGKRTPASRMIKLAEIWRKRFLREQIFVAFTSLTVALGFASGLAWAIYLLIPGTYRLEGWIGIGSWLTLGITAIFVLRIRQYLVDYLGDVTLWTTTSEKDLNFSRRLEILRTGELALVHVLRDPTCERIVVVGHSLGSAIAHECLMSLGRQLLARKGIATLPAELAALHKISHFITIGSPIDRMHYFFELTRSRFHRYNRVRDRIRGHTADPPFRLNNEQSITWLNIFDSTDPISSALYSPLSRTPNKEAIQNVSVRSLYSIDPLKSHVGYLSNASVLKAMFACCILGRKQIDRDLLRTAGRAQQFLLKWIPKLGIVLAATLVWFYATLLGGVWLCSVSLQGWMIVPIVFGVACFGASMLASSFFEKSWPLRIESVT